MAEHNKDASALIPFSFETHPVRVVLIDDQSWFVAADVCEALGIRNPRDAVSRLDDDEKATVGNPDARPGEGAQAFNVINESGLYALIFTSRKAAAKRFRKWVTAEVLPTIRQRGRYDATTTAALPTSAPSLTNRRWLVSFDHAGTEHVQSIADDALILSRGDILKAIATGNLALTTEELFSLSTALLDRLKLRTPSAPALPPTLSNTTRKAINRRAWQLARDSYETLRQRITHAVINADPAEAQRIIDEFRAGVHYPRELLEQPYFISPQTNRSSLNLSMLTHEKFDSPLRQLLDELTDAGNDVAACHAELDAMRELLQRIDHDLDSLFTDILRFRTKPTRPALPDASRNGETS